MASAKLQSGSLHWQGERGRLSFAARGKPGAAGRHSRAANTAISFLHWEQIDEYFRKNHERDLRQPRQRDAGRGGAPAARCPEPAAALRRRRRLRRRKRVDVAPILDKAVAAKHEKLEWRTSIVDLMKALDIDSSLAARKELAKELGYTGDTNDSASMNVWLHKQVMAKLAANGGKLPPEIKH